MKYSVILICFFLSSYQFHLVPSPLMLTLTKAVSLIPKGDQEKDNAIELAAGWNKKGNEFYKKKEYNAAIKCYKKAIALNPQEVHYVVNLASTLNILKKFVEGENILKEALRNFKEKIDVKKIKKILAYIYYSWGDYLSARDRYKEAIEYYNKELTINRELKDRRGEGGTLNNIGLIFQNLRQYSHAIEYFEQALPIHREVENRAWEGKTLENLGLAYKELDQYGKAIKNFDQALTIKRELKDRRGEGGTLNNIGLVYENLRQYNHAIEYYEQALAIHRKVKNSTWKRKTLGNLASVYISLNQYDRAIEYYNKVLSINREIKDRTAEGGTLNNLAMAFHSLNQYNRAIEYYKQALAIHRKVKKRDWEGNTLNNLGLAYTEIDQFDKAIKYGEQALAIKREIKDRIGEGGTLNNLGTVYNALGQYDRAIEYFEKALKIHREFKHLAWEGNTLNNLGNIYSALGEHELAIQFHKQALSIKREVKNRSGEAHTFSALGIAYKSLGQYELAIKYHEKALAIYREVENRSGEAVTLDNLGTVYNALGQYDRAVDYYESALAIHKEVKKPDWEGIALFHLMYVWETLRRYPLAIYYGKQSINVYQKLRENISGLEESIQISYLENKKNIYRTLIVLLIAEARLSEAQQILDMLKEEEYLNFIRKDRSAAPGLSTRLDFTPFEKQWIGKYNTVTKKLSKIGNEYRNLRFKPNKYETDKKRIEKLELKLKKAQKFHERFLARLKTAFEKHEKEIKARKIDPSKLAKKASQLQKTLKYLDEIEDCKNAALHYMVYKGRISIILTTPSSQSVKQTEIDEKEFNLMIMNYRNLIVKLGKINRGIQKVETSNDNLKKLLKKKKEYEKKLYDAIFKPINEKLKKYGATNLMISLDGVLRYIPLATLWDGENYLVQKYRMARITPFSLKNIRDKPIKDKKILGLGASQGGSGFKPLHNVRREIRAIVKDEEKEYKGLIKGKAFIDNDFTEDIMISHLKSKLYNLVHIASHFKFSPGDETKNHLLLGDGNTMKLSKIRQMGKLFDNVTLLVLSACQTGVGGNGEEIDGFGELAQQSGAKSVVASLWSVADESTKELMVAFYRKLKKGKVTSKIEALRQAQLELAGLEDLLEKNNRQGSKKKSKYSHPYYWGPFIMIGNLR